MAHDEFSREEIPSDGVSIGGDDDCEHATYRRFGSDGGGNIYFECTNCSNVILNYDTTDADGASTRDRSVSGLTPNSGSDPEHDPLMKGLSFDSGDSDRSRQSGESFLAGIKSDLESLLPFRKE